jgi:DNA-binding CsgD family transcriptional regulator
MLVVGGSLEGASFVTLYRVGRDPVVLNRATLQLHVLLDLLRNDDRDPDVVPEEDAASVPARLTLREREVLSEVARGGSSRVIAERLGIQTKTVENHKANIYAKLDVQNQAQAVATAMRAGLVDD